MKPINESTLQTRLDSGSTKRLKQFRSHLSADDERIVFDDKIRDVVLKYALFPEKIMREIKYLNTLTDLTGVKFARSIKSYDKMKDTWEGFLKPEKSSFQWNQNYQYALRKVKERYSKANLVPIQYSCDQDIIDSVTDWTTSSGFAFIEEGKRKKVEFSDGIFSWWSDKTSTALNTGSYNTPMIPGVRTQCSGEYDEDGVRTKTCKHKTRPIWMVSLQVIIAERIWAKPLTKWLSNYSYSAIGKDDSYLTTWVSNNRRKYRNYISLDYTAYDSSMPSWLIKDAFDVVAAAFGGITDPLFKVVVNDFIYKNLITAEDVFYISHGDPSGSGFTAIINGICNEIMTETWAAAFGLEVYFNVMGDDNLIYLLNEVIDLPNRVASYLEHNFGVKVNATKSSWGYYDKAPEYLSRFWTDGGAYRHPNILLSKMLFPEKFRDYVNKPTTPELVLYSYYLSYPVGLRELIDVPRFLMDNEHSLNKEALRKVDMTAIPYLVRQWLEIA